MLLILALHAKAQLPDWVESGSHPDYPSASHILGLGSGQSAIAAEEQALLSLSKQLCVAIEAQQELSRSVIEHDGRIVHKKRAHKSEVVIKTCLDNFRAKNALIKGARVAARHHEPDGAFYALTVLNARAAAKRIIQHITRLHAKASEFLVPIRDNGERKGDAVRNALAALAVIDKIDAQLELLPMFSAQQGRDDVETRITALRSAAQEQLRAVSHDLQFESSISGQLRAAKALAEPIEITLKQYRKDWQKPLAGVPLRARYDQTVDLELSATTDQNGNAQLTFTRIGHKKQGKTEIEIMLDADFRHQEQGLPKLVLRVEPPRKSRTRVAVIAVNSDSEPAYDQQLRQQLTKALKADGYKVVKHSKAPQIVIETHFELSLTSARGRLAFAYLKGELLAKRASDQKLLFNLQLPAEIKRGGNSHKAAVKKIAKALRKELEAPLLSAMERHLGSATTQ